MVRFGESKRKSCHCFDDGAITHLVSWKKSHQIVELPIFYICREAANEDRADFIARRRPRRSPPIGRSASIRPGICRVARGATIGKRGGIRWISWVSGRRSAVRNLRVVVRGRHNERCDCRIGEYKIL